MMHITPKFKIFILCKVKTMYPLLSNQPRMHGKYFIKYMHSLRISFYKIRWSKNTVVLHTILQIIIDVTHTTIP